MAITPNSIPRGLSYADESVLLAKLERFATNMDQIHMVADFDRTLTQRRAGNNEDITSWNILRDHLPLDAQAECHRLFQAARPKELAGTMTEQDAIEWWSRVLDIYTENHLDMKSVESDFLHRASMRNGSKELFDHCSATGIPTVILSAGIKDAIDLWSAQYDIAPTLTLSTELLIDESQCVIGWKPETLVHLLNKSEVDHPELNRIRSERPLALVVGDSINDADMALGEEDVLRVRIYDPRPDEIVDIEAERAKTFAQFDLMIENESLEPLVELLKSIAKS